MADASWGHRQVFAAIRVELGASNKRGPGLALAEIKIALVRAACIRTLRADYQGARDLYRGQEARRPAVPAGDQRQEPLVLLEIVVYFSFVNRE